MQTSQNIPNSSPAQPPKTPEMPLPTQNLNMPPNPPTNNQG